MQKKKERKKFLHYLHYSEKKKKKNPIFYLPLFITIQKKVKKKS